MKTGNAAPLPTARLALFAIAAAIVSTAAAVQQVVPAAAYAENSYVSRDPVYAINGAGLDGETHVNSANNTMWMGANSTTFAKWFLTDLGSAAPLHSLKFWNYNQVDYTGRGVKVVDIYVSTSDSPDRPPVFSDTATWTLVKADHTVVKASGADSYTGDDVFYLPIPVEARWIGFDINSIHTTSSGYGGIAEVQFFSSTSPVVQLDELSDATATSVGVAGTLVKDNGLATHVLACVGADDGGRVSPGGWGTVVDFGVKSVGTFQGSVSGLTADRGYHLVLCATNGVDEPGWSFQTQTFITGVVSVDSPGDVYESSSLPAFIPFTRPVDTTNVALTVQYTLGGSALPGQDYEALSGTFTFPAGEQTYALPLDMIDNGLADGNRTVTVSVNAGTCLTNATSTTTFTILDDETLARTVTWTGAGGDLNWTNAANWNPGVPLPIDTVVFTDSGLSSGDTIALGANQSIRKLTIAATTAFTIGHADDVAAGYSLSLTNLERQDVDGTEGRHVFGTAVALFPDGTGNANWSVNGSSELRLTASLNGAVAGVGLVKSGTGTLALNDNTTYTGTTTVLEGAVNRPNFSSFGNNLGGNVVVGSPEGTVPASYSASNGGRPKNATVYPNGTYTQGDWPAMGSLTIIGGTANCSWSNIDGDIKMTGGSLLGGPLERGGTGHYTYASPTTARITGEIRMNAYTDNNSFFDVQDGAAPIDLWCSGTIDTRSTNPSIIKRGPGVMRLTGTGSVFNEKSFKIDAGTALVDNLSGAGAGKATVVVAGGATLGGTGFIGGVAGYSRAHLTASGSSGTPAVIAPGTIDSVTGAHVLGTLSVGSTAQTNNVTFGANSRLVVSIGKEEAVDQLLVEGVVDLSSTSDSLALTVDPEAKAGVYTLVSASGGIVGAFNAIDVPKPALLTYTATTVDYTVPALGTLIIVR